MLEQGEFLEPDRGSSGEGRNNQDEPLSDLEITARGLEGVAEDYRQSGKQHAEWYAGLFDEMAADARRLDNVGSEEETQDRSADEE